MTSVRDECSRKESLLVVPAAASLLRVAGSVVSCCVLAVTRPIIRPTRTPSYGHANPQDEHDLDCLAQTTRHGLGAAKSHEIHSRPPLLGSGEFVRDLSRVA